MHRIRAGRVLSAVAVLSLALTACGKKDEAAAGPGGAGGPPSGEMKLPVETVTLKPEAFAGGVATVGSLRADESVVVRPETSGRVERIHFTEGGTVGAGQVLFTLDGSLARAALNEASANLDNSRRTADRANRLGRDRLLSQSDIDTARARYAVDQARVESARTALSKLTLRAPFAGRVGLREVSVGEVVNAGQALVTLVRTDPIEVDFSVPETQIPNLRAGQRLTVSVDAYPGDTFGGEVAAIDPVIDPQTRSAKLRARIPNPDGRLKPGQFAKLTLDTGGGATTALLVPEQALMQDGDTRFVYAVVDGKAKRTTVKTGARVPGKVEVTDGLKAGDVVITAGQAKPMMRDGVGVMALPPAGAAPAAKPAGDAKPAAAATSG